MRMLWLLLLLTAVGAMYHYKCARYSSSNSSDSDAAEYHGFVQLPKVIGFNEARVMIIAAENCPRADAQRADRLAQELQDRGIPVSRAHEVEFNPEHIDLAVAQKIPAVMDGPLPIVFIHGRAKGNPTLDDVVAEYQASLDSPGP